jgi:hypothetical protein
MAVTGIKSKSLDKVRPDVPVQQVATTGELVRFNFFIDRAKLKALKTEALERDVSVADLVREALDARVNK